MFSNLIESGSHRADLKRKGKFFLGATMFYTLLLAATGVGSIYAYNARLDDTADYEILSIMRFSPAETRPEQPRREEQRPAPSNNREQQFATRIGDISVVTPYHPDRVAPDSAKDVSARVPVVISDHNSDPKYVGGPANTRYTVGPGGGGPGAGDGAPRVEETTTPPPLPARVTPTPAERKGPLALSTLLSSKIINKPAPPYPALAKQIGVQGSVIVQFLIDEQGHVVNAKATSGHPLLQAAAVQAAYKATFTPTVLSGKPTTVTGVITYNFVLNK